MTADDCLRKLLLKVEDETDERCSLLEGASVLRFAGGVEAAFIAYSDGAAVEGAAMCAYFVQLSVLRHRAIFSYIKVIAHVDEASRHVVALELLGSVVLGLAGGGTVNYYVADGASGHLNAFFDISEELVLGGDLVATDGERKCFLDHSRVMHDVTQKRLAMVVMMVITALKISYQEKKR